MLRTMSRWLNALPLTGLTVVALALGPSSLAHADKVGIAAAVHPDAFSEGTEVKIGNSIFYNQRINTTGSGLVQVLLVDGSTFTVGPGSDLVIDKFVYDPNKNQGEVVATLGKGVLRFVGGKLSKNEGGVTVNTPTGALAIRGGMFQGKVDSHGSMFSFLFGVEMKFTGANGEVHRVYEPGYTLDLTGGAPKIRPTLPEDTAFFMKALSGGGHVEVGGNNTPGPPHDTGNTKSNSLSTITAQATQTLALNQIQNQEKQVTTPPEQLTVRVLTSPGTYTAFPNDPAQTFTTHDANEKGILGGDADPTVSVDDFTWTFNIVNGRTVGTVSGLIESHQDCSGGPDSSCQTVTKAISPADINFPAPGTGTCLNGICTITDATITQNDGTTNQPNTTNYIGTSVQQPGFFAYQLIDGQYINGQKVIGQNHDPILAFGGTPFNFGQPSGKLYLFNLTPDVSQNGAFGPFASGNSSPTVDPTKPLPSVSPLAMLQNDSNPNSRTVWLQTTFYIKTTYNTGTGDPSLGIAQQDSFINVALGGTDPQTGGLVGARRGGSQVDISNVNCGGACSPSTTREALAFTGDIATLAGPDGSQFLGSGNPNMVIGFDSTGTHNIGRDIPLNPNSQSVDESSGSTYHVGYGIGSSPSTTQTLTGTYHGYASGMVESQVPAGGFSNVVASTSSNDLTLAFDPVANSLTASITVRDVQHHDSATEAYTLGFGGDGRSAYIDDQHYAAIESSTGTSVNNGQQGNYTNVSATSYLASGDQLGVTKFFPQTFGTNADGSAPAFCTGCDFLQWGAWGTRVNFQNTGQTAFVDNIHTGWWVAGDVVSRSDLPTDGTASYSGHAIGNVANNISGQGAITYVATGDMGMTWDFNSRLGRFRHHPLRYIRHTPGIELRGRPDRTWRPQRKRLHGST